MYHGLAQIAYACSASEESACVHFPWCLRDCSRNTQCSNGAEINSTRIRYAWGSTHGGKGYGRVRVECRGEVRGKSLGPPNISQSLTMTATLKTVSFLLVAFPVISLAVVTLRQADGDDSIIYQRFHITSDIVTRYAYTQVNSVVLNSADTSKELSFQVQLPETAFISNFTM